MAYHGTFSIGNLTLELRFGFSKTCLEGFYFLFCFPFKKQLQHSQFASW